MATARFMGALLVLLAVTTVVTGSDEQMWETVGVGGTTKLQTQIEDGADNRMDGDFLGLEEYSQGHMQGHKKDLGLLVNRVLPPHDPVETMFLQQEQPAGKGAVDPRIEKSDAAQVARWQRGAQQYIHEDDAPAEALVETTSQMAAASRAAEKTIAHEGRTIGRVQRDIVKQAETLKESNAAMHDSLENEIQQSAQVMEQTGLKQSQVDQLKSKDSQINAMLQSIQADVKHAALSGPGAMLAASGDIKAKLHSSSLLATSAAQKAVLERQLGKKTRVAKAAAKRAVAVALKGDKKAARRAANDAVEAEEAKQALKSKAKAKRAATSVAKDRVRQVR